MKKKYYYHFTFEKYYNEMLKDGYIIPGKHRNYLPYDENTGVGEILDNPNYSSYTYLSKSIKQLQNYIFPIQEDGIDFLNQKLMSGEITEKEYCNEFNALGDIIILRIPEEVIDKNYLVDDFNNVCRNRTFGYSKPIDIKNAEVYLTYN